MDGAKAFADKAVAGEPEFINIYYGEDANAQDAQAVKAYIESLDNSIEVEVYEGGQSHYYYVISVE